MRKDFFVWVMAFLVLFACCAAPVFPCSCFVLQDDQDLVFGRNFDFYTSRGLIVVNHRNAAKTALLVSAETPVSWVSRYGSITFNQIGKEFPFGGMNEKGLVVEMMSLPQTGCPPPDGRAALMEMQWIQYQLDNCATVQEVIQSNDSIRITAGPIPPLQHYLICDRSGNTAAIEFIEGKFVCHTGEALPVPVLTNSTYEESLAFYESFDSLTFEEKIRRTSLDSQDRFAKIARWIHNYRSDRIKPIFEYAYDILGAVSAGKHGQHCTAWSIIYDVKNLRISFKTYENRIIRTVDFGDFDFDCSGSSLVLDMTSELKGNVAAAFVDYTPEINRNLVSAVLKIYSEAGFMGQVPEIAVQVLVHYPESVSCK